MSIVKDFVPVFCILFTFLYCFYLRHLIKIQKEHFINILKHDLKVPVLAKKHALGLIENANKNFLIKNIREAENTMLDLINSAITAFENDFDNDKELIILSDFIIDIFKSLDYKAEDKKITFYYMMDDTLSVYANKVNFAKVITYLTVLLIQNSPNYGKIMCSAEVKNKVILLKLHGYSIKKINNTEPLKNGFMPVGHGIKTIFCKSFLKACKWKFKETYNKNKINTFTIEIPPACKSLPQKTYNTSCFEGNIPSLK